MAVADVKLAILRVISQARLMPGELVYNHGFEPSRMNHPFECGHAYVISGLP